MYLFLYSEKFYNTGYKFRHLNSNYLHILSPYLYKKSKCTANNLNINFKSVVKFTKSKIYLLAIFRYKKSPLLTTHNMQ